MSDYLNNLVARTLRLAPVVQPRLASLFEPVAPAVGNAVNAEREVETGRDPSAAESGSEIVFRPSTMSPAQQPWRAPAEIESQTIERRQQNAQANNGEELAGASTPPAGAAVIAWSVRRQVLSEPAVDESNAVRIGGLAAAPSASESTRASANLASSTREALDHELRPRISPRISGPAERFNEYQFLPGADAAVDSTSQPPTSRSSQARGRQNNTPVSLIRSFKAQPPAPAAEPKTIRVTIGRIDVRAVFPPPTAIRNTHAERPAAMSLDEYLRKRSERRR